MTYRKALDSIEVDGKKDVGFDLGKTNMAFEFQLRQCAKKNEKHRPRNKRIQASDPLVLLAFVMFPQT